MENFLKPSQSRRCVMVNADDFGLSAGVNEGILEAHRHGIVTSASLMVRGAAAAEAAERSREFSEMSIGLHVDLAEWAYRHGGWVPLYEVVDLRDPAAVRREVLRQLDCFRQLMDCNPSHLDSHQHLHREEPLRTIMITLARQLSVPLRHFSTVVRHRGTFYGQTAEGQPLVDQILPQALLELIASLAPGFTEIGCHPGYDDGLNTMYRQERRQEVRTLCDARLWDLLEREGIQLCSFHALKTAAAPAAGVANAGPERDTRF